MSEARAKELIDLGNKLYTVKDPYNTLCQEIAENVYPERANFTTEIILGHEFAEQLMDSHPVLLRRELGNSLSAMLRPKDRPWFKFTTQVDKIDNDAEASQFLEYLSDTLRSRLYDPRTNFIAATKQGDHDFVSFGQPVISVEEAPNRDHLFVRCHHLRDCAWLENEISQIDHLHRKDQMTARAMKRRFGEKKLHESILRACEDEPGKEFPLRVIVMPSDEYDYIGSESKSSAKGKATKARKLPFVCIYIDVANCKVIKEAGLPDFIYAVPRWHTISGSQYAFSPAAMTSLPDARMAQQLARILLEAGEKAVNPPLIAREEAVREGNLQAGALNWVDMNYDGKVSDHFEALQINADMKVGFLMRQDLREMLAKAWFIDKLALPEAGKQMTAYEVAQRLEEHVRNLLPLFEPMEVEYNTKLLDKSFALLDNMGAFDWSEVPQSLRGRDVTWRFKNPLQEISDRILVQQFQEALQIEMAAMQAGVKAPRINMQLARDDAVRGVGVPASWRYTDEEMDDAAERAAAEESVMQAAQEIAGAAGVTGQVADADLKVSQALQGPPPQKQLPAPKKAA